MLDMRVDMCEILVELIGAGFIPVRRFFDTVNDVNYKMLSCYFFGQV